MLRQAENKVRIEGILAETNLKPTSYVKNGETVEAIGGDIRVLVEQVINGEAVALEVPVYMFSNKYTKTGTINPAYTSIETVMRDFTSIAASSKEQADKVRITGADIRMNEYYRNGQLVSQPRVNASFVSRAVGEFKPEASFSLEFMVSNVQRVVDKEGVEVDPAKAEATVIVPQYGGRVDLVKLTANNPNVITAMESYWEPGKCYKASGRLNFSSTTRTILEEVDFGEPIEKTFTVTVHELVVTGGSQSPLDGDFAFDQNEIKEAMAQRAARLEALKNKPAAPKAAPAKTSNTGMADLGF